MDFDALVLSIVEHLIAKQLTTASWCCPVPLTVGQAGTSAVSLQGVPLVTCEGHCEAIRWSRDTLLTICRSMRDRTTADSCREDTVTASLYVATMQEHAINSALTKRHAECSQTAIIEMWNHIKMQGTWLPCFSHGCSAHYIMCVSGDWKVTDSHVT